MPILEGRGCQAGVPGIAGSSKSGAVGFHFGRTGRSASTVQPDILAYRQHVYKVRVAAHLYRRVS